MLSIYGQGKGECFFFYSNTVNSRAIWNNSTSSYFVQQHMYIYIYILVDIIHIFIYILYIMV